MNGRIYDPGLGRFLSADIVYQDTANGQAFNRYSYGFNSPFSGVDPTGYALEVLINQIALKHLETRVAQERDDQRTWGSYLPGTEAGDHAAQYWADIAVNSDHPLAPLANVPGVFSALWTEETAVKTALTLGTAGTGGVWASGSGYLNGIIARGIVNNSGALRLLPQAGVRGTLDAAGWSFKSLRASTAARGGWAMQLGTGPEAVIQWSAAGGRHSISYWKVTGSSIGTLRVPYFRFGSVPAAR